MKTCIQGYRAHEVYASTEAQLCCTSTSMASLLLRISMT